MKSCSPRVCLNCILQKKAPQTPALASHNSPNAISSDFVCLIWWGYLLFFVDLVNPEPLVFKVAHLFTLSLKLHCKCLCTLTYKRWPCACYIILPHFYLLLHHFGPFPSWLLLTGSHASSVHSHMWKSEGRSGSGWFRLGRYLGLEWVDIQPNRMSSLAHTH